MRPAPGDLRSGIAETANALGMNPVDLATIISYETGGTFNPTQAGPTTKWGQHRGLIQFGEPQARQFGVDWNDPLGSQLGPNGAIVKYFTSSGWKPGMGMLDAYSIVNAGGPGKYNASDTAAGGAPGTVRDKVEQQMGGHRQKAAAMLGEGGSQYGLIKGDSPSEGGARFGGTGLGDPANPVPVTTPVAPEHAAIAPAETDDRPWWQKALGGLSEGAPAFGGNVATPPMASLDVPKAALAQAQPGATIDQTQADMRRQKMAEALMRLNAGKLG